MKKLENTNTKNYFFSNLLISYFANFGVKYAFISPGSRNTSLTQAVINNKDIKSFSIIDERSSAYVGLGKTKSDSLNRPVLIITTSGTAVANLFPAIVESFMSKVPMIVISADRPKRLIGTGSNQTIYQNNIFGKYAQFFDLTNHINKVEKYFKDFNKNNYENELYRYIKKIYKTSIYGTKKSIIGNEFNPSPVHLNIPYDEPLFYNGDSFKFNQITVPKIKAKRKFSLISKKLGYKNSKILIICTDLGDLSLIKASNKYHIPIFMESRSSKYGKKYKNIITSYDNIIKYFDIKPDIILRFGSRPVSKKLNQLIDINKKNTYLLQGHQEKEYEPYWIDTSKIEQYFELNKKTIDVKWCNSLIQFQKKIKMEIESFFSKPRFHEGYVINQIIKGLPKKTNLLIGNSSPIRDLDSYTFNMDKKIKVFSNRGASGIDGLISTAIGMSIDQSCYNALITGDVSFYYDLTALNIIKNIPVCLTIFIINNSGGHIFDRLDSLSTQRKSNYEKFWLTNPNVDFKDVAKVFGCSYYKINLNDDKQIIKSIHKLNKTEKNIRLIELEVDAKKHHSNEKDLNKKIKKIFI